MFCETASSSPCPSIEYASSGFIANGRQDRKTPWVPVGTQGVAFVLRGCTAAYAAALYPRFSNIFTMV